MEPSIHHLNHVNYWAIFACAFLQWMLGAAWYSPALFSKIWMKELGITPDPSKRNSMIFGMVSSLVGDIFLSFVLWHMVMWANAGSFAFGTFVGFLCWFGFFVAPNFAQGIYEGRSFKVFAINNGYWLIGLLASGGILAVWR